MRAKKYQGFLLDPQIATIRPASILDPVDPQNLDPMLQMKNLIGCTSVSSIKIKFPDSTHILWYDHDGMSGRVSAIFHMKGFGSPLAGRAVLFADDNKTERDEDCTPFGLPPSISMTDFAQLVAIWTYGEILGFNLALTKKNPAVLS